MIKEKSLKYFSEEKLALFLAVFDVKLKLTGETLSQGIAPQQEKHMPKSREAEKGKNFVIINIFFINRNI